MRLGFWWNNIGNFINKLIGLFRTNLRLLVVGDSYISDLFLLADKTIAFTRRIFMEGNFQPIFISYYSEFEKNGNQNVFTGKILKFMFKILLLITFIFCLAVPFIAPLFKQKIIYQDMLMNFLWWLSPLIILIFLMSFFSSVLIANKQFKYPSIALISGNIVYVLIFYLVYEKILNFQIGTTLTIGAISYAAIQCIIMGYFARKYIDFSAVSLNITEFKNDIFKGMSINAIIPFSEIVTGIVATSVGSGIFSHIEYGHKYITSLFQIIGIPIATAITPSLAKKYANGETKAFSTEATNAFVLTHILTIPFVALLYFFTEDVLIFFFKRIKSVSNLTLLCKTIGVISLSLYFMMQNRILNTLCNVSKNINITLVGYMIYGLSTLAFTFVLKDIPIGLAWAGNIACLLQFVYLFVSNLQNKNLLITIKEIFYIFISSAFSFIFIYYMKYLHFAGYYKLFWFVAPPLAAVIYILICKKYIKILFIKED